MYFFFFNWSKSIFNIFTKIIYGDVYLIIFTLFFNSAVEFIIFMVKFYFISLIFLYPQFFL